MSSNSEQTTPTPDLPPAPAYQGETPAQEGAPYQPLSLLALTSLGLAVVLGVVLVVGAVAAFFTRSPLLLPPWLLLVALAVVLLAWVARRQIQNSEGTLGGLGATRWAIGICLVGAPLYAAYYTATYFAVTAQAERFTRQWLNLLAEGEIEKAFWVTVAPGQRPAEGQQTRDTLEVVFNQPNDMSRGNFTGFRQRDEVRLLRAGGKDARIDFVGIKDWVPGQGGYEVSALYKITTPQATFVLVVTALGTNPAGGAGRGRQWTIQAGGTRLEEGSALNFTSPEARSADEARLRAAHSVVAAWTERLNIGDPESAFLATLSRAEADRLAEEQKPVLALGLACGPLPPADVAARRVLAARQRWFGGEQVDLDPARFWTSQAARPAISRLVRQATTQGLPPGGNVTTPPRVYPLSLDANGRILTGWDVHMTIPRGSDGKDRLAVDGLAVVRLKKDGANFLPDGIERIEWHSARSLATSSSSGPRPGP